MTFGYEFAGETSWPDLEFTLRTDSTIDSYERQQLEDLLVGWYTVGVHGGFGSSEVGGRGVLHNMSGPEFADHEKGLTVTWSVDMGSVSDDALDVLLRSLKGWSDHAGDANLLIS
jgi:hypothetical protein